MATPEDRTSFLRDRLGLMSEQDLMLLLGVSGDTLQQWRCKGAGPRFVKLGKQIFYREEDVTAWIDANIHSQVVRDDKAA